MLSAALSSAGFARATLSEPDESSVDDAVITILSHEGLVANDFFEGEVEALARQFHDEHQQLNATQRIEGDGELTEEGDEMMRDVHEMPMPQDGDETVQSGGDSDGLRERSAEIRYQGEG